VQVAEAYSRPPRLTPKAREVVVKGMGRKPAHHIREMEIELREQLNALEKQ